MKPSNSFIIAIPQPCAENWAEMRPQDQGRFCAHCQKTVVDVRDWDDQQLATFYRQQTDAVCVRMLQSQLGRPISVVPEMPQRTTFPYAAALGLGFILLAQGNSFAQAPMQQATQQVDTQKQTAFFSTKDSVLLKGQVINEANQIMSQISVMLMNLEQVVRTTQSDTQGCFTLWVSLADISKGQMQLRINDNRYQPLRVMITDHFIRNTDFITMTLQMLWRLEIIHPERIQVMGTSIGMEVITPASMQWHKRLWVKKYKKIKKK